MRLGNVRTDGAMYHRQSDDHVDEEADNESAEKRPTVQETISAFHKRRMIRYDNNVVMLSGTLSLGKSDRLGHESL
jgi:hypothetical protein